MHFLEGNVITPLLERRIVRLPPALVMSTQLFLAVIAGPLGLALAAPLAAAFLGVFDVLRPAKLIIGEKRHSSDEMAKDPMEAIPAELVALKTSKAVDGPLTEQCDQVRSNVGRSSRNDYFESAKQAAAPEPVWQVLPPCSLDT